MIRDHARDHDHGTSLLSWSLSSDSCSGRLPPGTRPVPAWPAKARHLQGDSVRFLRSEPGPVPAVRNRRAGDRGEFPFCGIIPEPAPEHDRGAFSFVRGMIAEPAPEHDRGAFSFVRGMIAERFPSLPRRLLAARSLCRSMCGQRSAQRQLSTPEPERLHATTSLRARARKTPRNDKLSVPEPGSSAPEPGRLRATGSLRESGKESRRSAAGA